MADRYRNKRIEVQLTEEELELFKKKMAMSKSKSMSHFIRKCVLEKDIFVIDMSIFRGMQHLLGINANNINQIAKKVNSTGIIYRDDIEDIKRANTEISRDILKIQNILTKKFIKRTD
ncbi:MAG: MobC family plasmid mobilization relaxosome protein [Clostridiales bacterium]|nr:MobC family plasmid mobilization relaxosome protein [Clostridiales bacterium]